MGIRIRVLFQEICQQAIYIEQIELDGHTRTSSLPGESSCSKSVNQNAARSYVNPDDGKWRTKWFRKVVEVMEDLLQSMLLLKTRNLFD